MNCDRPCLVAAPRLVARGLCLGALGLLLTAGNVSAQSLAEASAANWPRLRVGSAVSVGMLTGSDAAYANTLRWQFQSPSPENALKWGALRPGRYEYRWTDSDRIIQFARAGGQQVRGHALVWHQSMPGWLSGGGFTPDDLRDQLFHHIDTVVGRYRSDTFCWDVVNEAFHDNGTLRTSLWFDSPGIGYAANGTRYIEETFLRARQAGPDVELIYNDYGTETVNAKSDAVYAMAQDFLNRGVPLDGIGFQMHLSTINYASLRTNLRRFNDLGLNLHITEMDVRIPVDTNGVATAADLAAQAEVYWNVLGVALGQPRFTMLQTWGFTDKHSWIPGFFPGYGAALPVDEDYQRKPAYWAIWNALANQAEKLPVRAVSAGNTTLVFSQDTLSAGAGRQLLASATNAFMTLDVAVPFTGQWEVKVGYRVSGASGRFQVAVAPENSGSFTDLGGMIDAYGASIGTGMTVLGTNYFATAGNWQFRFTVVGRNPSATAHNITIDYIRLTPVLNAANTPPTISNITDKTVAENSVAGPYAFTIGDAQTPASGLVVEAVSLNTNLLPAANVVLGGSGASRTLTLTPAPGQSGSAAVLLLVSDGTNQTPETFTLNVTPVNAPPVVTGINLTLTPGATVDVDLATLIADDKTPVDAMRLTVGDAVGGTVTLLPDGRTARFTGAPGFTGAASFRYTATDAGPDARWLLHYSFEPPDTADDQHVNDQSAAALSGTLVEWGTGESVFETNVPPALAPFSARSLRLFESGAGNAARLEASLPAATHSLRDADWTLAFWFNRAANVNDDFLFYLGSGDGFSGDGDELDLYVAAGQLRLRHYNTNNVLDVSVSGGTIATGAWHHVALAFDRTNVNSGVLRLYLNGAQIGASTAVTWRLEQTNALTFGGVRKGNEARWFNGHLDDLALFKTVLSSTEIASLAAGRTVAHLGGFTRTNTVSLAIFASNAPPVLAPVTNQTLTAGVPFALQLVASDPDSPAQSLQYQLLSAPPGAVLNATNGLLTWRPTMAQAGTGHAFTVVVTEAGWRTNVAPVADVYVRNGTFAASNHAGENILLVKQSTVDFTREAFLRFPLPTLPGTVASASLRLHPVYANLPGGHVVAAVTNNTWDEATLTWNTKPESGPALASWSPAAGVPVSVPVTDALQAQSLAEGLVSFRVHGTNVTADGRVDYASREAAAALAPQLQLLFTNAQPLSATQSFQLTVLAPPSPVLSAVVVGANGLQLTMNGMAGPDCTVLASTNLLNWEAVFITNAAPASFTFLDTSAPGHPARFYRVQLGP